MCIFYDILKLWKYEWFLCKEICSKEWFVMYSCVFLILKFLNVKKKEDNLLFLISIWGIMDMKWKGCF